MSPQDPVDRALQAWRQGDAVVGEQWFAFRFELSRPLVPETTEAAAEGVDLAEARVAGFVVVTQTCDIIRPCAKRPFVEIAPLRQVDATMLRQVQSARSPQYAYVPGIADRHLVADLDRIMTAEKPVVAAWERIAGCRNTVEARAFALALSRKRVRFAFPNEFVEMMKPLQDRLLEKHDRRSPEGDALRALREIRVMALPDWTADEIEVFCLFVKADDAAAHDGVTWDVHLENWQRLVRPTDPYKAFAGIVVGLTDITAHDYVYSEPLDLDHLSNRT